jgi:hypothetical protein
MIKIDFIGIVFTLFLSTASCVFVAPDTGVDPTPESAAWTSLAIENGKPMSALNLIAGQEYIFDRLALAVDNRGATIFRAAKWRGDHLQTLIETMDIG